MSMVPYPQPRMVQIINRQYCRPCYINLNINRRSLALDGKFIATDISGNVIFKVDAALMTLHNRRVLHNAAGHPIVTLHKKIMTLHDRWEVFRGDSTDANNLLFSVKRKSMIQWKIKLYVFLAYNISESTCDFMVDVNWFKRSCVVYAGQSSTIVATMENNNGRKVVTVYPNVDYAFIAALIVILDDMKHVDGITKLTINTMTGDFGISDILLDSFWR
ncbi:hypothetical protein L6164_002450 [Bauhinia variegata]|uniref:Uncharacterized protein n=1 Tax=Bauhinia variegata TaxID=167791 RepID=A0ACB9PYT7_BAUVA|nr:hypothetical protein L6164_002450 [Bauhinia variegata]